MSVLWRYIMLDSIAKGSEAPPSWHTCPPQTRVSLYSSTIVHQHKRLYNTLHRHGGMVIQGSYELGGAGSHYKGWRTLEGVANAPHTKTSTWPWNDANASQGCLHGSGNTRVSAPDWHRHKPSILHILQFIGKQISQYNVTLHSW